MCTVTSVLFAEREKLGKRTNGLSGCYMFIVRLLNWVGCCTATATLLLIQLQRYTVSLKKIEDEEEKIMLKGNTNTNSQTAIQSLTKWSTQ